MQVESMNSGTLSYQELLRQYHNVTNKLEEHREYNAMMREMYIELLKDHQKAVNLLNKIGVTTEEKEPQEPPIMKPCAFIVGNGFNKGRLAHVQAQKRIVLMERSQSRVNRIREASRRRAVVSLALKEFAMNSISGYDEMIYDLSQFSELMAAMNSIEAFPMQEIRRDTYRRLINFGVFQREQHEQKMREAKALRALLNECATEQARRRLLALNRYSKPIKVDKFRRQI
ncbi:hypothetical protein FO519_000926 [Halicephalobus sp. NKZ332]|nr:hypothetical protein FO519_000926 [Halicephalobus sp. NKZ332]